MQIVPLQPVPAQTLSVMLSGQACQIDIAQKTTGIFVNLSVNNSLIIGGVVAENGNPIVRSAYLGFYGDIMFLDTQPLPTGSTDPVFTGLGSRYVLAYLLPTELAPLGPLVQAETLPS